MWMHIIGIDTKQAAGTIGIKKFNGPLSNQALLWFDNKIAPYVVGHLEEIRSHSIHNMIHLRDSVGSNFFITAYKDLR
jgi:hypothetical protein